jgi:hypothetical protein
MKIIIHGGFFSESSTNQETKINSIRHYLDCPLKLEDGITFGTFFKHIINI